MKHKPVMKLLALFACICLAFTACQKETSLETNQGLAAHGSLQDSTGTCMPDSVVGTFYGGVEPGRDTAYVLVKVNVTVAGTYSIYTDVQNGFYFSDSGYFSSTGLTTVKLKPIGIPIIPGTTSFNVNFDSSVCSFVVNVKDSTGTGIGGGGDTSNPNIADTAWQFTGPVGTYGGPIGDAFTYDTLGGTYLNVIGLTKATGDTAMQVVIFFPSGVITPGTYSTKSSAGVYLVLAADNSVIYGADPRITDLSVETRVTIDSYDTSTKIVRGTFNGNAKDAGGNNVNISGKFTAKVN